jgi:hypothetical protein
LPWICLRLRKKSCDGRFLTSFMKTGNLRFGTINRKK